MEKSPQDSTADRSPPSKFKICIIQAGSKLHQLLQLVAKAMAQTGTSTNAVDPVPRKDKRRSGA